jgi:hypothetical protein
MAQLNRILSDSCRGSLSHRQARLACQSEFSYEVYPLECFSRDLLQVVPHGETEGAAPVEKDEDSEDSDFYADE